MRTALRKIGNSTGLVLPRAALGLAGLSTGASLDISVEGDRIVLTPVKEHPRAGWEEDARLIGSEPDPEAEEWLNMPNENDDAEWTW